MEQIQQSQNTEQQNTQQALSNLHQEVQQMVPQWQERFTQQRKRLEHMTHVPSEVLPIYDRFVEEMKNKVWNMTQEYNQEKRYDKVMNGVAKLLTGLVDDIEQQKPLPEMDSKEMLDRSFESIKSEFNWIEKIALTLFEKPTKENLKIYMEYPSIQSRWDTIQYFIDNVPYPENPNY